MTIYRLMEEHPEGDCFYLPRLCVFCQVVEGAYNEGALRHLTESEIEHRGVRWDGMVGSVPPLTAPVDIET